MEKSIMEQYGSRKNKSKKHMQNFKKVAEVPKRSRVIRVKRKILLKRLACAAAAIAIVSTISTYAFGTVHTVKADSQKVHSAKVIKQTKKTNKAAVSVSTPEKQPGTSATKPVVPVIALKTTVQTTASNVNPVVVSKATPKLTNTLNATQNSAKTGTSVPVNTTSKISTVQTADTDQQKQATVYEALGRVLKSDENGLTMDVDGQNMTFISDGSQYVQNELSQYQYDNGVNVRYTVTQNGSKVLKDSFLVYSHTQGELDQYIEADFFEGVSNTVTVYINNKSQTFELSPYFIGKDVNKMFSPGSKIILDCVETAAGLVVENIQPQE